MGAQHLERARDAHARCRWEDAYRDLHAAAGEADLDVDDLAMLADASWWLGRNDESLQLSEQVHRRLLDDDRPAQAAQVAMELGFLWMLRGEPTVGSGWISRATRLLADLPECPAHGYLLYLEVEEATARGELDRANELAHRVQELGDRHDDATLRAIGLVLEGVVRIRQGHLDEGLSVLDEAMLPVRAGRVTPNWTGNLYCQLMALFIELADIPRARAWTEATERWCDGFGNVAMFRGICRVHRAQLLHLEGDWSAAEQHATQARRDLADMNVEVVAEAEYRLGELHRLRDDPDRAEQAYLRAHGLGREPQPGMALLRLTQRRPDAATASLDAALAATDDPLARAPLLAARVEVAFATGEEVPAAKAAEELVDLADTYATPGFVAMARQAAGTVRLLVGQPDRAIPLLRDACRQWRKLDARHDTARVRARLGQALAAVGDQEAADREQALAAATFEELGAAGDLRRLTGRQEGPVPGGLSSREAEVLALVSTGRTNRQIAEALTISERTVERHLSNIFLKLDVSSRTEAAGFAFANGLAHPTGR